jgi:hypothetical protein
MRTGKREQNKMFVIEYVVAQERANPSVVYRVDTRAYTLRVVEQVARGTLDVVRRMFPTTPPDGFQIFDDNDEVVLRSWESVSRRLSTFGALARSLRKRQRRMIVAPDRPQGHAGDAECARQATRARKA